MAKARNVDAAYISISILHIIYNAVGGGTHQKNILAAIDVDTNDMP